jgi:hypothetical protein
MMKTLVAKVAVAALATGGISLFGATAASAAPTGQAAPRDALSCEFYLAGAGYQVGPKVTSACNTAADGFPTICDVLLVDAGVASGHASRACALGAQ